MLAAKRPRAIPEIFPVGPIGRSKQCSELRDRVYEMLSHTSQQFRDYVPVNYEIPLSELSIRCGKACLQQDPDLFYLQLIASQKRRRPDLPSWCLDLEPQEVELILEEYLRAGLYEASKTANGAKIKVPIDSNDIELERFRADILDRIVPMEFQWTILRTRENARLIIDWIARCQSLACEYLGQTPSDVPIQHFCTLLANIRTLEANFDGLVQAYNDQIAYLTNQAGGMGDRRVPPERRIMFD
jgi:hypothetical protein